MIRILILSDTRSVFDDIAPHSKVISSLCTCSSAHFMAKEYANACKKLSQFETSESKAFSRVCADAFQLQWLSQSRRVLCPGMVLLHLLHNITDTVKESHWATATSFSPCYITHLIRLPCGIQEQAQPHRIIDIIHCGLKRSSDKIFVS